MTLADLTVLLRLVFQTPANQVFRPKPEDVQNLVKLGLVQLDSRFVGYYNVTLKGEDLLTAVRKKANSFLGLL